MSGHSKWATIKHKKAKEDAKRGKVFTKLLKEISIVAREGGGDPEGNPRLRTLLDKAKAANMPQDNINRAIKKATGEVGGAAYEAITYEGHGPSGTAVMVEALTDNKNRTASDVRHVFTKFGGSLGALGSVAWMFEHKGVILTSGNKSEDELFDLLLNYNLDDISYHDGLYNVTCAISDLEFIKEALIAADMKIDSAEIQWVAKSPLSIENEDQEKKIMDFLEALQDLDDVQDVFTNLA